jgi:hypothetical protein
MAWVTVVPVINKDAQSSSSGCSSCGGGSSNLKDQSLESPKSLKSSVEMNAELAKFNLSEESDVFDEKLNGKIIGLTSQEWADWTPAKIRKTTTVKELKSELTARGISFASNANEIELVKTLKASL